MVLGAGMFSLEIAFLMDFLYLVSSKNVLIYILKNGTTEQVEI